MTVPDCLCEMCRPHDPAWTYTRAFQRQTFVQHISGMAPQDQAAFIDRLRAKHGSAMVGELLDELAGFRKTLPCQSGGSGGPRNDDRTRG